MTKRTINLRRRGMLALLVALATTFTARLAQPDALDEYVVKAALIYKIAKFVSWPEGAFDGESAALNFCIIGKDPFGSALDRWRDRVIQGRGIQVRRLAAAPRHAGTCHIAFISASVGKRLDDILNDMRGQPVLTIGDLDGFAELGGVLALVARDTRIEFEINQRASLEQNIGISSQLLMLARLVETSAGVTP